MLLKEFGYEIEKVDVRSRINDECSPSFNGLWEKR